MSVVTNIQGSVSQTQQAVDTAQQQAGQARQQQGIADLQAQQQAEIRRESVTTQEDVDFSRLEEGESGPDPRKRKNRKKTLPQEPEEPSPSSRLGGSLVNTLA